MTSIMAGLRRSRLALALIGRHVGDRNAEVQLAVISVLVQYEA